MAAFITLSVNAHPKTISSNLDHCFFEASPMLGSKGEISGKDTVCYEDRDVIYSIDPVDGANTYIWFVPEGATYDTLDRAVSIIVDFNNAIGGSIKVVPSNESWIGDTIELELKVILDEVGSAGDMIGDPSLCLGTESAIFTIYPVENATSYIWTHPSGSTIVNGAGTNTVEINIGSATQGIVSVVPWNSCFPGDSSSINLNVKPYPNTSPIAKKDSSNYLVCLDTNQSLDYKWGYDFAGQPMHIVEGDGNWYCPLPHPFDPNIYTYWLKTVFEGDEEWECYTTSYLATTGIKERLNTPSLRIFPNPSQGRINIRADNLLDESSIIEICELSGKQIYHDEIQTPYGELTLNLKSIIQKPGIYLVILRSGETRVAKKLIISN